MSKEYGLEEIIPTHHTGPWQQQQHFHPSSRLQNVSRAIAMPLWSFGETGAD
jgi:hypothetical protein